MSSSPDHTPALATARRCLPLSDSAKRVLMLVNRKAGAGRGRAIVQRVVDSLAARKLETTLISDISQLYEASHQASQTGDLRAVVSAGGDGTLCAALNNTPPGTPLAVLPLGTENLLARYLNHRRTPQSIVELLTAGVVVSLDAARAGDRLFSLVVSAGLDAEVVRLVHKHRKGNITHLAYMAPLLRAIGGYRFPRLRVTSLDAGQTQFDSIGCWAFAVNLPRYALNLPIAPHAVGIDGLLDTCVLGKGSFPSGMWYLGNVLMRRHHLLSSVRTARSPSFRIEAVDELEVPYQIDGDPGGVLPVEVSSVPERLQVVVDPKIAAALGFCTEA